MTPHKPTERKTWRLSVAAVAIFGAFLVFYELNDYRTLTKHEGFVAVVSKEMLASGDWIVPRFGGLPRLKKPPLSYWCAASVSGLLGQHAPWTARLPSALSALFLAGLIGWWAGRWYGRWAGLSAAVVQLSSVYVISFSRKAEVDMLLCLLTTSALFLVANASRDETRRRRAVRWIGIYALIGLSWLAKFHYGPAMVLGVVAVWHVVDRRRPGLWDVFHPPGLLILAAAVAIWPWLLLQKVPEAWTIWRVETVGRAVGQLGRDPVWFYLPQVIVQALPWSVLLIKAGPESFQRAWKEGDRRERFLWVWFFTQLAILSASAFKHHHYLMAALPALSLILGRTLCEAASKLKDGRRLITPRQTALLAGAGVLVGGAMAAGVSLRWPHLTTAATAIGLCWALASLLASYWLVRQRWLAYVGTIGLAVILCYAVLMSSIFPHRDSRWPTVQFARDVRQTLPEKPICIYGLKEDPLVYYLEGPVFRAESPTDLAKKIERRSSLVVLTDLEHLPELELPGYQIEETSIRPQERPQQPLILVRIAPAVWASSQAER